MKTIGIIAEYNPFHNGHAYQIAELKRKTNADFVVIAMSGDFVQRGAPAIIDKYCRAEMALLCGADLVIELPAVWAVSSAEDFAMAGVTLFDKMGCIDGICFGAESDQLPQLKSIAGVLAEEPDIYRSALSSYLKKGLAFPAARAAALSDYFKSTGMNFLISILDTPNNILAVEYLKALKRRNSATLQPLRMTSSAFACSLANCPGFIFARAIGFCTKPFQPVKSLPLNKETNPSPCGISARCFLIASF